ncbi:DNA mismatch repair protein MutS [Halobaculum sp. MBLA0147]|uniref:DNA mismatch repair protein MutS n=1 Tax=Halobaculum sp. MBLA0147 TaxID=3079934 RepID=UPI003525265B
MPTGAPAKLLERREELTPMLSQYVELAETYDDALLLFRVGDFYKAFCETADEVARVCELTRIEREDSTGTYTACGVPVDNAATYLDRLLDAGHRLAVADQVEDPEETTGLVDRAVTRVLTPGTVVDDELLGDGANNYVACLASADRLAGDDAAAGRNGDRSARPDADDTDEPAYGLAHVDVSTGECAVTSGSLPAVADEVARVAPAELLLGPSVDGEVRARLDTDATTTTFDADAFAPAAARERLHPYTDPDRLAPVERVAAGALLAYAEYTQGDDGPLSYVARVRRTDPRRSLRLDATALRGLELFEAHTPSGQTLVETVDETRSALGRRRLEAWLRRPLVDAEAISARHDAVAALADDGLTRAAVRDHLDAVYDLERLVTRAARERADARDLRSLADTLAVVPELRDALDGVEALADVREALAPLTDLRELLDEAIVADPPQVVTEGDVIREGFDAELDELRATARAGREWVADLEARERERTGIDNLEVGYTQVHGYYIEVTNSHLDAVPDDYTRRQTLKNAERFYTPELKRREDEILSAEERSDELEYELFCEVRERVAAESERVQATADAVARLDTLAALATVAVEHDYCRPEIVASEPERGDGPTGGADADRSATGPATDRTPGEGTPDQPPSETTVDRPPFEIERGRHPVVERTETEFVPNDATLPAGSVTLLTGPNMSGKSTYMRQVALAVVLAQAGSFVPATAAQLPVVDRVFTRVGASDDIAGGQSTFMREMAELTDILHDATGRSLVLLDEVGRGTSTADGHAIARAAVEFLHDEVGATTIFATHYHDLTGLADRLQRVRNRHFAARREDGDVTFLHRVREGAASSSYGVEVAEMAGVPQPVVDRARELVAADDGDTSHSTGGDDDTGRSAGGEGDDDTDHLTGDEDDAVAAAGERGAERAADETTNGQATLRDVRPESADGNDGRDGDEDENENRTDRNPAVREVVAELAAFDAARTTPMEALERLHDLQRRVEDAGIDTDTDGGV